jgi:hypothetical protein
MSAAALIKFTQNAVVGTGGQAYVGTIAGGAVTVENTTNTGVGSWQIDLVDVPSGSALTTGTLASGNTGTPTTTFTPDQDGGCYRIVLKVWTASGRPGNPDDTDIRNFVVLSVAGFAIPPAQIYPAPLPSTASGLPGNKPNELNISGQERGWAGAGTDGLLDNLLKFPMQAQALRETGGPVVLTVGGVATGQFVARDTGSSLVGSYPVASLYALGNTTQNSSTSRDIRSLSLNGAGIVTVGYSNGTIQVSATTAAQTNQSLGLYGVGNTTENSSTTLDARTVSVAGRGIVTVGYSNGTIEVSATTAAQTNQSLGLYGVGNTTENSSTTLDARTVSVAGRGIVTVGYSNGTVEVSATTAAQTNQTAGWYAVGNTTENSSTTLDARTFSVGGRGIVTVGYSNGTVEVSATTAAQTAQTVGFYAVGNTTENSSTTLDARTVSIGGRGMITVGYSSGTLDISATQSVQTEGYYAVGNTTENSSTTLDARTLSIGGRGMITVGYSNGTLDISATQSVQTGGFYAVGNTTENSSTTLDLRTVSIGGRGAATVGYSSGTLDISVATQTNQTLGIYASGNTTGATSSSTYDARSLSVQGMGIASVGWSAGVLEISVPSGGGIVTLSAFGAGNTTESSSGTLDQRSISFGGRGAVSVGVTAGTIDISVATQTNQTLGFYAVGNTTQNSSTTLDARTVSVDGLGAISAGYSNGSIQISAPPVSSIVGTGGVVVTTNGSTISISGENYSNFEPYPIQTSTTTFTPGAGSWYVQPFQLPANLTGGRVMRPFVFANASSNGGVMVLTNSASWVSNTSGSRSVSFSYANTVAVYSLGAGGNSTRLESVWSNTFSLGAANSWSLNTAAGTNMTLSIGATISYITSVNSAGAYTTTSSSTSATRATAAASLATTAVSSVVSAMWNIMTGSINIPIGLNTTLTPGNYWLAEAWNTASTTAGTSLQVWSQSARVGISVPSFLGSVYRLWGATAGTSNSQLFPGDGLYTSTSTSPPTTMAFTDIVSFGSALKQYFNVINSSL